MSGRKKAPVETNVDEQDDQEAAEAEVDALLESPEGRRQEDSDEEDFDDDDSEDSELKRQRKEEAKLKELMAEAEKELAEKWAKATFWSELKAMIPYTKEYREEQAELREMSEENSISRIRRDLARCAAVERLLRKGEWERALARMKREMKFEEYTDFQRAKADMEEKGEWDPKAEVKYKPKPKHNGILGALIKRLKPQVEEEEEEEEEEESAEQKAARKAEEAAARREREGEGEHTKLLVDRAEANMTCTWRMKGKEDKWYVCTNEKVAHITQTRIDIYGRTRPVFTAFCKFHMKTCYNDHGMRFVRVAEANELGLCNECYVRAKDRPPLHVDPYTVPGVSREKRAKEQQQDTINDDDEGLVGGKPKLCRWQPDRHNNEELKYTCTNPVFRNVLKHKFESFCAYHLPICWEAHGDPDPAKLLIQDPNVDGLCNSHFLLAHHRMPPRLRLPFPGMVARKRRSHPMGPADSPREHIVYRRFADDGRPVTRDGQPRTRSLGFTMKTAMSQWHQSPAAAMQTLRQSLSDVTVSTLDSLKRASRRARHRPLNSTRLLQTLRTVLPPLARPLTADRPFTPKQVEAVLLFQRHLRRHLANLLRKKLAARRKARARLAATLTLQAWARARVQRRFYVRQIRYAHRSATRIQAAFRGFMVRKYWRLRRAARTITRALARHYGQGLHMSYQYLQHERWVERNWTLACITLQRVIRGFFARRELARRRAALALRMRRVLKAQCYVRRWLATMFVSQYKARLEAMWRSALLIQTFMRLVRFQKRCNRMFAVKERAANRIQKRARLYLARKRAACERRKQDEMWKLWSPKYFTKADVLPWLRRSAYNVPPSPPTMVDLRTDSWYSGLSKDDGFDEQVVKLLLTLDSQEPSDVASQVSLDSTFAYRDVFAQFDKASLGIISKSDFIAALTLMWESMGHDLQPDEARSLVDRFDVERDGHIRYRLFFFYALQHTRPCSTHGRVICGDCCYYGGCNKYTDPRTRCKCEHFSVTKEAGGRASVLCSCGHAVSTHQILPSVLKETAEVNKMPIISENKLNACVRRLRNVVDQGDTLEASGFNVLAPYKPEPRRLNSAESDAIRRDKIETRRRARTPWRDETYDEWAVRMLTEEEGRPTTASSFFRGRDLDDLWPMVQKERLYVPRPGVNADQPGAVDSINWRRPETPRGAMLMPGTKLLPYVLSMRTMQEEVGIVLGEGKMPVRQSHNELNYGFLITVPVPVVVRKELRACKNPVALYLHLLSLFSDPESRLLDDERAYTHVIAHHCVFIERHWKKFIKDIQTGTLDEFIPLSPSQRDYLETRMAPNPKVAAKLERLLCRLGFHRRASGGMVQSKKKPHADPLHNQPSDGKEKETALVVRKAPSPSYLFPEYASPFRLRTLTHKVEADAARRQSAFHINLSSTLPLHDPAVSGGVGSPRPGTQSARPKSARSSRPPSSEEQEGRGTQSARQGSPDARLRGTTRPGKSRGGARPGSVERKVPEDKRGEVVKYQQLKRTASVSDIDRQALPNREILRLGYELIRKPFPIKDPILEQDQRRRRRHVCGHPGCGRTFTNREVAETHLKAHDFCSRLGVGAPLSDQYMQRYWPAGVPWRGSPMIKKTLPLAVYYCPLPECTQNFGSLEMFMQHVRCGHSVQELRKFGVPSLSGVEWIGNARPVPPLDPPVRSDIPVCTNVSHAHPHLRCAMCRAAQAFEGPRPPLRFFDKGKLTLRDGKALLISFIDPESTACIADTPLTRLSSVQGSANGSINGSGSGSGSNGNLTARSGNTTARSGNTTARSGNTTARGGNKNGAGGVWAHGESDGGSEKRLDATSRLGSPVSYVSHHGEGKSVNSSGGGSGSGNGSHASKPPRKLVPVHCVGLCEDREGKAWIGAARYLDASTLRQVYGLKKLPSDFDRENELMQSLEVEWLPLSRVKAYSYTLCCSRADFKQRRLEGSLPKNAPAKFSRYVFSTATRQVVGHRTVAGDPYKTSGVDYTPPTMLLGGTLGPGMGKTARFKVTKRVPSSLSGSRGNSARASVVPPDTLRGTVAFQGTVAFAATGGGEEAWEKPAENGAEDFIDTRRDAALDLPPVT